MSYHFFGWEHTDISPINPRYALIRSPKDLYDLLSDIWCADTCAPRMRNEWSPANKTLGHCSVTAFLAQDIFGGKVYGVPLPDGNFHCYNVVDGHSFDLTSEQFGNRMLSYAHNPEQLRTTHFSKEEKRHRYELLKKRLIAAMDRKTADQARDCEEQNREA